MLRITSEKQMQKAMIAMSGGVDSSVAALLMKERGYDCVGVTMKLFSNDKIGSDDSTCCSLKDTDDARGVAWSLEIPHYVFNFQDDFDRHVIKRFVESYQRGKTPNPCIDCNKYLKFERLLSRALQMEYDFVVTGHYAKIEWNENESRFSLKKANDAAKDQSYFLYSLTQEQLSHVMFPVGELFKAEVREIAARHGLLNAKKRESQDICFVPNGKYTAFLERFNGEALSRGDFTDSLGNVLGRHKGQACYTIGQRKGLGISSAHPLYVVRKNSDENTVTLGIEQELYSKSLNANDFNWIRPEPEAHLPIRIKAKTRYRQIEQSATAERLEDGVVRVTFDESQRAITPGQAVVLYKDDEVVGGGTIICSL
ncbi:tRNA-specific 2-thiouridylase MnmA [Synergistales bacterium]|nr:tRNA-specific 2-thiouridylase MnmA [Synergistales bacterium]